MICWVLYDISNDKSRNKASKICQQQGLIRVQLSCFVGEITKSEIDAIEVQMEELIDKKNDKVYIFTMSKTDFNNTVLLGQAYDKKFVSGDLKSMFI
ncbi:MAG: CRISPR-associated endonuclease Cas2 [Ignavibacteriaceae bacterium]|nr:CRISPR-associated endonuclease Cas2 [Ignavibacteriaceae bacterium]